MSPHAYGRPGLGTSLERILNRMSAEAGYLERLEQIPASACDTNALARAFVGQQCLMLDNGGREHAPIQRGRPAPDCDVTFIVEREQQPEAN
jgi:hypothetical protein